MRLVRLMGLIDSHAHLSFPGLADQVDAVLARCAEAGVDRVITVGVNLDDAKAVIELASGHPDCIHAAVGFHPHEADKVTEADLRAMGELWDHPGVVALGEIGLDYHYDFADRAKQRSVFTRQLEMATRRPHPLIIHCREAFEDAIPLLVDHGYEKRRVVFHCFTGTSEEAVLVAERGWRISFTGVVTFKKSVWLQDIARTYPADELMIESDAPYLSPAPVRKKHPNEPANIVHTARFLSVVRGVSYDQIVEQTSRNTRQFFNL